MRDRPAIRLGAGELARDLDQSHALLAPYARLRWARPGSGWYTRETVAAMRKGYGCALGSVYPYDATIPSSAFAGRYILRNVRPGAVIVLHDGGGRGGAAREPSAPFFPSCAARLPRGRAERARSCGGRASTASWKDGRRSTPNLDDPPPAGGPGEAKGGILPDRHREFLCVAARRIAGGVPVA